MTKPLVSIYYPGGAYGTFIEWCLNYFSDLSFSDELPFNEKSGNAHKFTGNTVLSPKMLTDVLNADSKFMRMHPGFSGEEADHLNTLPKGPVNCHRLELKLLEEISDNVVVLYFGLNNVLWGVNNLIKTVVEKNEATLDWYKQNEVIVKDRLFSKSLTEYQLLELKDVTKEQVKGWGKNSIEELELWELREFLSLFLHGEWEDLYGNFETLQQEFPNCTFIEIGQLRDNFVSTIQGLFKKLNLPMERTNVQYIEEEWNKRQFFKNKDKEISNIVQAVLQGKDLTWEPLSIVDEAEVQKQLRDNGKEIKCYQLNVFPTSSQELNKLLVNE